MTTSQLQAACKPLSFPFWFQLDDSSFVSCLEVVMLDGAAISFVSAGQLRQLLLHRIAGCVQAPVASAH